MSEKTFIVDQIDETSLVGPIRGGRVADDWSFDQDHRKSNPGLHLHYTASAIEHILSINESIAKFNSFSNLNMLDPVEALKTSRDGLIKSDAAFAEAAIILGSISKYLKKGLRYKPIDVANNKRVVEE